YRMLETLREYGRERLRGGGGELGVRRAHRDWFERLALRAHTEWIGPGQLEWLDRLDREQANLREAMEFSLSEPDGAGAALRLAASLYEFWVARQRITEARYWLGRALAKPGGHPMVRAMALSEDTVLAAMQMNAEAGRGILEEARAIADEVDDETLHALVTAAGGILALFSGDFAGAVTHLGRVLPVFEKSGDVLHQVSALLALGAAKGLLQEPESAADCQEQARKLTEERGESVYRSYALSQLGYTAVERGDLERGPVFVKEGLRLARMIEDRPVVGTCLATLALVAAENEQPERAAVLVGAASAVGESEGAQAAALIEMFGHHTQAQQYAAKALSSRAYEAALRRGHEFDIDEAVAFALEERAPERVPQQEAQKDVAPSPLTKREQQVAELVAQGMTNRAIADKLVLSQRTVEWHVEHVLSKLQFTTRAQIAAWVVERERG
ncbi:LuxR C-terminal-related transcriptional regulator, partial [Speluncibacter jeojiensis]|uniref:LuxR C-terminal-related transcriptional regulator n=1 Tax=Speluncibacter jeojiensis TaxID=2710754 RepID=UPI0024100A58